MVQADQLVSKLNLAHEQQLAEKDRVLERLLEARDAIIEGKDSERAEKDELLDLLLSKKDAMLAEKEAHIQLVPHFCARCDRLTQ